MKIVLIVLLSIIHLMADASDSKIAAINSKASVQYVKPEELDRLMMDLGPMEKDAIERQDTLLLSTLKVITQGYVVNNHYKQGYSVYQHYLEVKNRMLLINNSKSLQLAREHVSEREVKDETEKMDLQNQLQQLQIDIDVLSSKRSNFKRYFSFGLIALSAIIAAMLMSYGLKLNSMNTTLKKNRERMKELHRLSVVGAISSGTKTNFLSALDQLENTLSKLPDSASGTSEEFKKISTTIQKLIRDIRTRVKI